MRSRGASADDLTSRARIRDAAVGLIWRDDFGALTVRLVAETASVSPGLVHYFGSKDGLHTECEEYVGDRIHDAVEQATANLQPYGSQLLAQYLVTADSPEGRVEELQRRCTVPTLEVFTQGLYTSTGIADRFRDQSRLGDADAPVGSPGRSRRTEPNAPAGDPPGRSNSGQVSPSQPAA